jgi:hypothetical protein
MGEQFGKMGEQFGKMGEQFGKMGEQFGKMGEQFGKMGPIGEITTLIIFYSMLIYAEIKVLKCTWKFKYIRGTV